MLIATADRTASSLTSDQLVPFADLEMHAAGAVQLQVLLEHLAAGDALAGWKVGMTSGDNRDKMGTGVRPFGFILASRTHRSGDSIITTIADPGIEPELGIRIGRPVGGDRVTRDEALAAIEAYVPCFEIGHRRLPADTSAAIRVAADLSQWGLVVGDPLAGPLSAKDLAVSLHRDGESVARGGPGFDIDDPVDALRALCAGLSRFGLGLLPGQVVITGAFAKARVSRPSTWRADFSGLGGVEIAFE
jgi:2-keto-4-pentenoate hydratase